MLTGRLEHLPVPLHGWKVILPYECSAVQSGIRPQPTAKQAMVPRQWKDHIGRGSVCRVAGYC